jgi:sensor histidine kinase YesM
MAKRIGIGPIRIIVAVGLLLMVVLFVMGVSVQYKIYQQAQKRSFEMAERIAFNNQLIFKAKLDSYQQTLQRLAILHAELEVGSVKLRHITDSLLTTDSSVVLAWSRVNRQPVTSATSHQPRCYLHNIPQGTVGEVAASYAVASDNHHPLLRLYTSRQSSSGMVQVGLVVDLRMLHQQLTSMRELQSAYTTIILGNRMTLYHPDEKLIGTADMEMGALKPAGGIVDTGWIQRTAQSRYLGIPVYRHSYPYRMGRTKLLISANVPNLDFAEFLSKTQRNLWLLNVLPMVLFVLFIAIGALLWKREFVKRKEMEQDVLRLQLQAEQQTKQMVTSNLENLKSGINPHFLFNSLGSLVALIKRDPTRAVAFTRSLSSQYRYLLEMERRNVVPIADEMEFTRHYVTIQGIRFGDAIRFKESIPTAVGQGVPPLAIQTLVENCIKHNAASTGNPLCIEVSIETGYIVVANNLNPRSTVVESTGKGISNLVKRYRYLTSKECRFEAKGGWYYARIPLLSMQPA